jgi:hypothetical protein
MYQVSWSAMERPQLPRPRGAKAPRVCYRLVYRPHKRSACRPRRRSRHHFADPAGAASSCPPGQERLFDARRGPPGSLEPGARPHRGGARRRLCARPCCVDNRPPSTKRKREWRRRLCARPCCVWASSTKKKDSLCLVSYKLIDSSYHTACSSCAPHPRRPVRPRFRGRLRRHRRRPEQRRRFGLLRFLGGGVPPPPPPPFPRG